MSYLEVFYNPSSKDWDAAADQALSRIDYTPDVIICLPQEPGDQLNLFNDKQKQGRNNETK
jgi:hypothetical protein